MFIFVVGAIYSNTKDVTKNKAGTETQNVQDAQSNGDIVDKGTSSSNSGYIDIEELSAKVDDLNRKMEDGYVGNSDTIKCKLEGLLSSDGGVEQTSQDNAIREAQDNNREIVLSCRFVY